MVFPVVMYRCESWTIKKAWVLKNQSFQIVVLEKTLESSLDCKEIKRVNLKRKSTLNIHWKDWCWSLSSITLATWWEELTQWKTLWCWERLRAGGERGDRGWDGWMASPTQWTWVCANSGRQWKTGKPGVLQSMGLQRVRHDWSTTTFLNRLGTLKNENGLGPSWLLKDPELSDQVGFYFSKVKSTTHTYVWSWLKMKSRINSEK